MRKESAKAKKVRLKKILEIFNLEYPKVTIQLNFESPFQLLVATILSAQCTDKRVNIITEKLFKKYKEPLDYAEIPSEELEKFIFSAGFYKAKTKNIKAAAKKLIDEYNSELPDTMEELLKLPGVGRKTANVILGHCFDTPGIVVDTHVIRISNRLGLVESKNPEKIEFELMEILPKEKWVIFTHYLINHGRKVCKSRNPDCLNCKISYLCPSANKFN
ncbi:MAG: endonuclease III [Ignavibacteria bacterium]|jgi:endonuclease-3|nr:endonuclease III [Ignavibacteria bacterium]